MQAKKEVKNLLNKSWFWQKRGGVEQRKLKVGVPKSVLGIGFHMRVEREGGSCKATPWKVRVQKEGS